MNTRIFSRFFNTAFTLNRSVPQFDTIQNPSSKISSPQQQNLNFTPYFHISFLKKKEPTPSPAQAPPQVIKRDSTSNSLTDIKHSDLTQNNSALPPLDEHTILSEIPSTSEINNAYETHRSLQINVDSEVDIPFQIFGILDTPASKTGYLTERVFAQNKIPKDKLLKHLSTIYEGFMYSLPAKDEEFLKEYAESNFAQRTLKSMDAYQKKGYKFHTYEDVHGMMGEPVLRDSHILDLVMVRGLSVNREENGPITDYHKYSDIDDMGVVIYTPLHITNPANFIDPEKNQTIYDDYQQVLVRMLVHITSPIRMKIFKPEGTEIQVNDQMYTWEHLALFETQLKKPPKFQSEYRLENYMEWLGKWQFTNWKIVDLDNWMYGNPLITKGLSERDRYNQSIFKGSKFDPSANIDIRRV